MVRPIATAVTFALLGLCARAQVDFTPVESFYEVEGIRTPNLNFHNKWKVISYSPPPGWKTSGRGRKLELFPPDTTQAGAVFEVLSTSPFSATEANFKEYRDLAVSLVPEEASEVEIIGVALSELRISGRPGVEVLLTYKFFAQRFKMNILFVPCGKEMLRFSFSAYTSDFASCDKIFRRSLYSMQGL